MTTLQDEDDFGAAEVRRRQDVARKLRLQVPLHHRQLVHHGQQEPKKAGYKSYKTKKTTTRGKKILQRSETFMWAFNFLGGSEMFLLLHTQFLPPPHPLGSSLAHQETLTDRWTDKFLLKM